jgi:PAS domain S-box-containing protein
MQNTELGKNRNELETNLVRYADLYDSSPAAYFTLARNGAIVELNLTGATLLGIGRSLLIGRNFKLFVPNKERPAFIAFLNRVFSSEAKESYETTLTKEGNPAIFVRIEGVADQFLQKCRMVVIDITERKQKEEELQRSEVKYRTLFENSQDAIFITFCDGTIRAANRAACGMFGMTEDELISVGRAGIIDPSDRRFVTAFEERERTGRFFGELDYLRKDGSSFQTETSSVILDGVNAFVMLRDITKRKKAEQDLRDNEERYRRLFEMESDAILLVDQETTRFLDVNIAAQKMYGYTLDEFLRLTAGDISAEPDKTRQVISAKQNWIPYRQHRKKDGTIFPVEIFGSYFEYKGRDVHVSSIRDITERKRAEGEIIAH